MSLQTNGLSKTVAIFVVSLLAGAVACSDDGEPDLPDVIADDAGAVEDAGDDVDARPDDVGEASDAADIGNTDVADVAPDAHPDAGPPVLEWGFEDGTLQGFEVDITDFSEATRGDLEFSVEPLPEDLEGQGVRVVAGNRSDDLWHFLWRELGSAEGVEPDTTYTATIELHVASNVPMDCVGIGGPPDAVWLKGGVVAEQPQPVDMDGEIVFSLEKGNQSQVGPDAVDLGQITTPNTDCLAEGPWHVLERSGTMTATSTSEGTLWVYVGGDSGFEGSTTLYYDHVRVTLTPK